MDDNTVDIRDDEINVEKIMQKIRENVQRRQANGELPPDPGSLIIPTSYIGNGSNINDPFQRDLSYINANWDIRTTTYFISSHHACIGKILVKGRQLVHGEVRRYVDPMIFRQAEFNESTARILTKTSQLCEEMEHKISRQYEELTQQISQNGENLQTNIQNCVDSNFGDIFFRIDKDLRLRMGLTRLLEERMKPGLTQNNLTTTPESAPVIDTNYFLFEERFRGSREDIKQRQLSFLPYFEKTPEFSTSVAEEGSSLRS